MAAPKKARMPCQQSVVAVNQPATQQSSHVTPPTMFDKPHCTPSADTIYVSSLVARAQHTAGSKQRPASDPLPRDKQFSAVESAVSKGPTCLPAGSATAPTAWRQSMPAGIASASGPRLGPVLCRKPSKDKDCIPDVVPPVSAHTALSAQIVAQAASAPSMRHINSGKQVKGSLPSASAAASAPAPALQPSAQSNQGSRVDKQARAHLPAAAAAALLPQNPAAGEEHARASIPASAAAAAPHLPELAAAGKSSRGSAKGTSWHPRAQQQAKQQAHARSGSTGVEKGLKLLPGEPLLYSNCLDHGCFDQGDSAQANHTSTDWSYPKKAKLAEEMLAAYRGELLLLLLHSCMMLTSAFWRCSLLATCLARCLTRWFTAVSFLASESEAAATAWYDILLPLQIEPVRLPIYVGILCSRQPHTALMLSRLALLMTVKAQVSASKLQADTFCYEGNQALCPPAALHTDVLAI